MSYAIKVIRWKKAELEQHVDLMSREADRLQTAFRNWWPELREILDAIRELEGRSPRQGEVTCEECGAGIALPLLCDECVESL